MPTRKSLNTKTPTKPAKADWRTANRKMQALPKRTAK